MSALNESQELRRRSEQWFRNYLRSGEVDIITPDQQQRIQNEQEEQLERIRAVRDAHRKTILEANL